MIVERFLELPQSVIFEGITFVPSLIKTHDQELKLCYEPLEWEFNSPHRDDLTEHNAWTNPLLGNESHFCSFLYLAEAINSDEDLLQAIEETKQFLITKNLI